MPARNCERLERLRPEQSAVREIFYCCLGLGFRGCYCLGREDELRLAQIRHTQAQRLAHPVEPVAGHYDADAATTGCRQRREAAAHRR